MSGENWLPVVGYDGLYEVSNLGRVKSLPRKGTRGGYIYPNYSNNKHYAHVFLTKESKGTTISLHRLVAEAFIPNPENKPQVNHIDGDKANNCVNNLEWVTGRENLDHAYSMGLKERTPREAVEANKRPVRRTDMAGNIKDYSCVKDAELELGIPNQNIIKVCQGKRKHAGGFAWAYL